MKNQIILELKSIGFDVKNLSNIDNILGWFKQNHYYHFDKAFYEYKNSLYKATYDKSFMEINPIYEKLKIDLIEKLIQAVKENK